MAIDKDKTYYCEKCGRSKKGTEFYCSNNIEKYTNDGCMNQCKDCMTMFVDNWDPNTFLWILQEVDVPWIPDEWNKLLSRYAVGDAAKKISGKTIIGRYLAKMQLKQYREYRWKDTEAIQQLKENEIEMTMKRQGYSAVAIQEQLQRGTISMPTGDVEIPNYDTSAYRQGTLEQGPPQLQDFGEMGPQMPELVYNNSETAEDLGLTEEDCLYLKLKWGKAYKPDEWVRLEQLYNEMFESYDIQTAGHKDTLILACKASLKSNQLLDLGDIEGAQKAIKMYDTLMKSGKFTAAQNKAENGEFLDSISELVTICEREGFIPRYYIDKPNDKVDETLQDIKNYTHTLVTEEMNLGNLIENAIKQMVEEEQKEEDEDIDDDITLDNVDKVVIEDNDYNELNELLEKEQMSDEEFFKSMMEGSDE